MADVNVRVTTEGTDEAKRKLDEVAQSGEKIGDIGAKFKSSLGPMSELSEALKGIGESSKLAGEEMETFSTAAKVAGGVLAGGLAISATYAFAKIKEGVENVRTLGDEFHNLSQVIGIDVETLGSLQLAAQTNSLSVAELGYGIQQLSRHLDDARKGTGASAEAFTRLQINIRDSSGAIKSNDQLLKELADRFSRMENGAGKTALAMDLFGRSGARMIPLLNEGAAGLASLQEEARRAGIVLSEDTARAADQLNDNLAVLAANAKGFWMEIGAPIVESLARITTAMREARKEGSGFWGSLFAGFKEAMAEIFTPSEQTLLKQLKFLNQQIAEETYGPKLKDLIEQRARVMGQLAKMTLDRGGFEGGAPGQPKTPAPERAEDPDKVVQEMLKNTKLLYETGKISLDAYIVALDDMADHYEENSTKRLEIEKQLQEALNKVMKEETDLRYQAAKKELEDEEKLQNESLKAISEFNERQMKARTALSREVRGTVDPMALKEADEEQRHKDAIDRLVRLRQDEQEVDSNFDALSEAEKRKHEAIMYNIQLQRNQGVRQMELQTWALAGELLQSFAGKSKAAAIAALVIQKGLAIASVIVNTQAAIARGYAELGPIAGSANAARMETLMAVQIGLIAATGLVQASSVASSGASLGTPANPVVNQPSAPSTGVGTSAGGGQTTVIQIYGTLDERKIVRKLIDRLNEDRRDGGRFVVSDNALSGA